MGLAAALISPKTKLEQDLCRDAPAPSPERLEQMRFAIASGRDPLGDAFCGLRSAEARRRSGAVYTPEAIVRAMTAWASRESVPARIVDPGAGSGRFLLAAAKAFPEAELVAVEIDPLAAFILRANAAALGVLNRLSLHITDYRATTLPEIDGPTLFIGNPPYVRHHDIASEWKDWFHDTAAAYDFRASRLAGLHIHFFLKTHQLAQAGDFGTFITSSEWLDTNYGEMPRKLLMNGLGGIALHVLDPTAMPFGKAAATGAITCFRIGRSEPHVLLRAVHSLRELGNLDSGRRVSRRRLEGAPRWTPLLHRRRRQQEGMVKLGEVCRVHRGQVTGCNAVWIEGRYPGTLPDSAFVPAITKARELFAAGNSLLSIDGLRRVIDLPRKLDELDAAGFHQAQRFLRWASKMGADRSYIARHRSPWWKVGLREPAPILCTYMARRPPTFVRNLCGAGYLNIAHGLYPREELSEETLDALAAWLRKNVPLALGRTYAGGLTKFEPGEIERLDVPAPDSL